jgi:hypothetical protein
MRHGSIRVRRGAALATLALLLSACGDTIVFDDRPIFEDPPAGAGEFLGYSSVQARRTVCGNCHTGKQRQWEATAHARAWHTLQSVPGVQPACHACHSVSSLGNQVTQPNVGWMGVQNARYQDVQCESCHGPGLTHVLNPDARGTKPLAPLSVGTNLSHGCGQCHSGAHQPFVEEWTASRHSRVVASRATNPNCTSCHEARGALQAWGIRSAFLEESGTAEHMAITCAVCHDPHEKRFEGQLRFSISTPVLEQNLCMKCHHRRSQPDPNSNQAPHSPQGPLLLGEAGWFPPNFEYPPGALVGSHGSDQNPRLCATCHVNDHEVRDRMTGAFSFRATGHSFQAIPCVDAQGLPTSVRNCPLTQRSFRSCTQCHLTESAARLALERTRERLLRLVGEIQVLIARIPASEFSTTDNRISTGEGARFNMQLALEPGSAIHNPFLVEALLIASIRQIGIDYGIRASPDLSLEPELSPP